MATSASRSAKRSKANPDWRVPRNSPGPRCSRSRRAISNPSLVSNMARSRWRATCDNGAWYSSTQIDSAVPRPTRPRSWCSCASPKRSACSMTISDAFGTSTPTSMTVVATSRSISPSRNARMTSAFSACGRRPWTSPMRRSGKAARIASWVSTAVCSSSASLSSTRGQTQYACRPWRAAWAIWPMTSSRRASATSLVTTGVRPGGNSSITETSRSAKKVIASVRGMGVALMLSWCGTITPRPVSPCGSGPAAGPRRSGAVRRRWTGPAAGT